MYGDMVDPWGAIEKKYPREVYDVLTRIVYKHKLVLSGVIDDGMSLYMLHDAQGDLVTSQRILTNMQHFILGFDAGYEQATRRIKR